MRWAARPIQRRAPSLSLQKGSEDRSGEDRSLTVKCIRILPFKIAIRNHFSTLCSLDARELHFPTKKIEIKPLNLPKATKSFAG